MSIAARKLTHDSAPQIYVACLAAYNNGKLHGRWIDASLGTNHIWDEINDILKTSPENLPGYPCEEWAIHDYMNFPDNLLHEYSGVDKVATYAEILTEPHGEAILDLHFYLGMYDIDETLQHHKDNFCGGFNHFQEYAERYIDDCGLLSEVPDSLKYYFDYDSFARDLEHDYIVIKNDGCCYVWHN